jgi:hypothetical protein
VTNHVRSCKKKKKEKGKRKKKKRKIMVERNKNNSLISRNSGVLTSDPAEGTLRLAPVKPSISNATAAIIVFLVVLVIHHAKQLTLHSCEW